MALKTTGKRRGRAYSYKAYLDRLRDGTDLDVVAGLPEPTKSLRRRAERPREDQAKTSPCSSGGGRLAGAARRRLHDRRLFAIHRPIWVTERLTAPGYNGSRRQGPRPLVAIPCYVTLRPLPRKFGVRPQ